MPGVTKTHVNKMLARLGIRDDVLPMLIAALEGRHVSEDEERGPSACQSNVHAPDIWNHEHCQRRDKSKQSENQPDKKPTEVPPGDARTHDSMMMSFSCP
jgi:hypothetical protein